MRILSCISHCKTCIQTRSVLLTTRPFSLLFLRDHSSVRRRLLYQLPAFLVSNCLTNANSIRLASILNMERKLASARTVFILFQRNKMHLNISIYCPNQDAIISQIRREFLLVLDSSSKQRSRNTSGAVWSSKVVRLLQQSPGNSVSVVLILGPSDFVSYVQGFPGVDWQARRTK